MSLNANNNTIAITTIPSLTAFSKRIKTIENLDIIESDDNLIVKIKANAFLHHMVRNIVGTLLKIGRGAKNAEWMLSVLESKDRQEAGPTAEPQGLYFIKAYYPKPLN